MFVDGGCPDKAKVFNSYHIVLIENVNKLNRFFVHLNVFIFNKKFFKTLDFFKKLDIAFLAKGNILLFNCALSYLF